jgi:hypothetical protein
MERIILTLAAILGLLIAFKFKGIFHRVISIGLTISALICWAGSKYIYGVSLAMIMLLSIVTLIYGLTVKGVSNFEKINVTTMGLFLTIDVIFILFHFPGAGIISMLMAIPIIITLTTFIKKRKLTKEMSFMIFWLVIAVAEFLNLWTR